MEQYYPILLESPLFNDVNEDELDAMLACQQAKCVSYHKGDYILRQGETLSSLCILLEGTAHIQRDDFWGNRSIISDLSVGDLFGESYAAPGSGPLLHDVVAAQDCVVLWLDVNRILRVCGAGCRFHSAVVQNLFFALSHKNRRLMQKLNHMSKRSTREKLLSYLSEESKRQNSSTFAIPFNRQELADFLSVDRSAMSNELGKLRDEGLLTFDKNRFTLL